MCELNRATARAPCSSPVASRVHAQRERVQKQAARQSCLDHEPGCFISFIIYNPKSDCVD